MSLDKAVRAAKARIKLLHKMLSETEEPTERVLARFCCETGVSMYTARRYLTLLVKAGLVEEVAEET